MPCLRQTLIDKIWRGQDPWAEPPASLGSHFQGWGSEHDYLSDGVAEYQPTCLAVEVGVWKGMSVITMASRMRDLGTDGVVIAVDTWMGSSEHWIIDGLYPDLRLEGGQPQLYDVFRSNIIERELTGYVLPLSLDSTNAAQVLRHFGVQANLLHIDAGHDVNSVVSDLNHWWPLLAPGGTLIGDDYNEGGLYWPGVWQGFNHFFNQPRLEHRDGKCRIRKDEAGSAVSPAGQAAIPAT